MPQRFRLPQVKPEHTPRRISDARIRLGGTVFTIAREVNDPTGSIWTLLTAMDGTRDPGAVVARVVAAHPAEKPTAVYAAIDLFTQLGHIMDAAEEPPDALTERERERYDRGRRYYRWTDRTPRPSWWEPQVALKRATVTIVGVGGTGGVAALAIAASGVGRIHCVDRDIVELPNLNRQILFTEADLGRPKVDAAADRLRQLNSDIAITGHRQDITGEADLHALTTDCDLLMLCADQPGDIRTWTNRACLATRTPWTDAGYHGPVPAATGYLPYNGPCYECGWRNEHERHSAAGSLAEFTTVRHGSNAVTAVTAGISGYLAADVAIAILTGVTPVKPGLTRGMNLIAPEQHFIIDDERRQDCAACGDATGPAVPA
jgi:molybdopterin/thiamine biosynthesis adenylyltransferase